MQVGHDIVISANYKSQLQFQPTNIYQLLYLTSSIYFQSAVDRADGMLIPNLHKALFVSGNPIRHFVIMRGHLEILDDFDKLLADNELESERQQLETEADASFTSSELGLRSGSKLLVLQNTNKKISLIVGHLIKEFISYCHANGLYPTPNYET